MKNNDAIRVLVWHACEAASNVRALHAASPKAWDLDPPDYMVGWNAQYIRAAMALGADMVEVHRWADINTLGNGVAVIADIMKHEDAPRD